MNSRIQGVGVSDYIHSQFTFLDDLREYFKSEAIIRRSDLTGFENEKTISDMIDKGVLEYVGRDLLIDSAWSPDDFLIRQLLLRQGIYSGSTALYLWGLSDQYPYKISMTFKRGYKLPIKLEKWTNNVIVRQVNHSILELFVDEKNVSGTKQKIRVYSKERALVDVLREPISTETINIAYRRYLNESDSGVNQLLLVAKKLGALEKVRNRLEVMM